MLVHLPENMVKTNNYKSNEYTNSTSLGMKLSLHDTSSSQPIFGIKTYYSKLFDNKNIESEKFILLY